MTVMCRSTLLVSARKDLDFATSRGLVAIRVTVVFRIPALTRSSPNAWTDDAAAKREDRPASVQKKAPEWANASYNLLDIQAILPITNGLSSLGSPIKQKPSLQRETVEPMPQPDAPKEKRRKSKKLSSRKSKSTSPVKKFRRSSESVLVGTQPVTAERRVSDISTLTLDIDKSKSFDHPAKKNSLHKFSSLTDVSRIYNAGQSVKKRKKPPQPEQEISKKPPPRPVALKVPAETYVSKSLSSQAQTKKSPSTEFHSLSSMKSASSTQSAVSNFESRTKIIRFDDKKASLASENLSTLKKLNNNFKSVKVTNVKVALEKAKADLSDQEWDQIIKGIEALVNIVRTQPEVILADRVQVMRLMLSALTSLRSRVCKDAAQAFAEFFLHLGKAMEPNLERVTPELLQRTADTSKFIRAGCSEALTAMCENVSVYKAISNVSVALSHKSLVVRAEVARLYDLVVTQLGSERFLGCSDDFKDKILRDSAKMLEDGSPDVRQHAKHIFAQLLSHASLDDNLKRAIWPNDLARLKKTLANISSSYRPA